MGQPSWGFPEGLQKIVLKGEEPITCRPGELLPPVDFDAAKKEVEKFLPNPSDQMVISWCLYPKVVEEYCRHRKEYGYIMRLAGVDVRREGNRYAVSGGYDAPRRAEVEGDWSNAAFWLCAGTLGTAPVSVTGLNPSSLQGDRRIVDIIRDFGGGVTVEDSLVTAFPARIRGCRVDAGDVPDLVPIVSVLGALAAGETRIVNAGRLRLKESDRLAAVENVLSALGAAVSQTEDGLLIRGGTLRGAAVDAWNDHRIAMGMPRFLIPKLDIAQDDVMIINMGQ